MDKVKNSLILPIICVAIFYIGFQISDYLSNPISDIGITIQEFEKSSNIMRARFNTAHKGKTLPRDIPSQFWSLEIKQLKPHSVYIYLNHLFITLSKTETDESGILVKSKYASSYGVNRILLSYKKLSDNVGLYTIAINSKK